MTRRILALFFSLAFLFCAQASAQSVDEIIKKHLEARGGVEKIKAIKSLKASGKILQQGLEIPISLQQKRPNKVRLDATFQGKTQTQAYDGQVGWKVNPFQGSPDPEKVAGDELKDLEEQADIDGALVDYKQKGHAVELVGKEDLEGSPVYKLKVTLKSGDVRHVYLDADKYLELKLTSKRKTPGGEMEIESFPGNYKPVNGVLFPFSIENKVGGNTLYTITVDKIEVDTNVDDAVFKMPVKEEKPKTQEKSKPEEKKPPSNYWRP
jgi:outer membrane lipoprotein-sorting protein